MGDMTDLWVSSPKGTCWVRVSNGQTIIVDTAKLWKRFKGQRLRNLLDWLGEGVEIKEMVKENKDGCDE